MGVDLQVDVFFVEVVALLGQVVVLALQVGVEHGRHADMILQGDMLQFAGGGFVIMDHVLGEGADFRILRACQGQLAGLDFEHTGFARLGDEIDRLVCGKGAGGEGEGGGHDEGRGDGDESGFE